MAKTIYPSDGYNIILDTWYYFGAWPRPDSTIFYYIYAFSFHLVFTYAMAFTMPLSIFYTENVKDTTEIIYTSMSDVGYATVLFLMLLARSKIIETLAFVDQTLKQDTTTLSAYDRDHILRGITYSRRLFVMMCCTFVLVAGLADVAKLIEGGRTTPFPVVLPFDYQTSDVIFNLVFSWQGLGIFYQVIVYAGLITLPPVIILVLNGYCDALGNNFTQLGMPNVVNGEMVDHQQFKKLIKRYVDICKIMKMIETICADMELVQFFFCAIILCTTLFQLTIVSNIIRSNIIHTIAIILIFIYKAFLKR